MPSRDVGVRLTRVFQEVFQDPELQLRPDLGPNDIPGWDSIRMVTLLLALERDYGVRFRSGAVRRIRSVGDVMRLLASHAPEVVSRNGAAQ